MGRQIIELVQVLIDRIEKNGYQQRAREENAFDLNKRLTEAEGWVAHWKQARQEAHEAGELMRAEIETLRQELADAKRDASDEFTERHVLTVEQQQDAAAWQQQVDSANAEVRYLRARLDEERSMIASLRTQLDAALALLTRERLDAEEQGHELGRLQAFVNLSRRLLGANIAYADVGRLRAGLAELDAGAEPTPVAEPLDAESDTCPGK